MPRANTSANVYNLCSRSLWCLQLFDAYPSDRPRNVPPTQGLGKLSTPALGTISSGNWRGGASARQACRSSTSAMHLRADPTPSVARGGWPRFDEHLQAATVGTEASRATIQSARSYLSFG
jgi:hypothetical protein